MTDLVIRRAHALTPDEARARVQAAAAKLVERFGADCGWSGDVLTINHPGVRGTITIRASEVVVNARLGLALRLMRTRAEAEITRILERELSR